MIKRMNCFSSANFNFEERTNGRINKSYKLKGDDKAGESNSAVAFPEIRIIQLRFTPNWTDKHAKIETCKIQSGYASVRIERINRKDHRAIALQ